MGKRPIRLAVVAGALVLVVAASALGKAKIVREGDLYLVDNGGAVPSRLPRHEQVPISAHIHAKIGTIDGAHPPAIRTVTVDFDKSFRVNARGLPACRKSQLVARSTEDARRACRSAIIGSGAGEVEVAFPEQAPFSAKGPILLVNGGVHGDTTLVFIHAYVPIPAPTAVVATTKITHIHRGRFRLHTVTQVPRIAGGAGSVTGFDVEIGRRFSYRGKPESYLTGSCPDGHYVIDGHAVFYDGTELSDVHVFPCTPVD